MTTTAYEFYQQWEKVGFAVHGRPFDGLTKDLPIVNQGVNLLTDTLAFFTDLLNGNASAAWTAFGNVADSALQLLLSPIKMVTDAIFELLGLLGMATDKVNRLKKATNAFFGGDKDTPSGWDWIKDMGRGIVGLEPTYGGKAPATPKAADKAAKMQALSEKQKKANAKLHGQKKRAIYDGIQQTVDKTRDNRIANNLTPAQRKALEGMTPAQLQRLKPHQRDYLQQLKNTAKTPKITTAKKTLNQSVTQNVTVHQTINTTTASVPKQVCAAAAAQPSQAALNKVAAPY